MIENNTIDIKQVEETNVIVGDTKMQNKRTKTITVEVQVHKELKKAEVENLFSMDGVFFEVKRRTIYATKEISLPKGLSFIREIEAENKAEYEIEDYVIETMQELYIEKCHAYVEEHERKWLLEEAERIAKLKEEGLIDENGVYIDTDINEVEEETKEDFVGETEINNSVHIDDIVKEETKSTGETTMLENNANNVSQEEENCFFSNNIFYYDWNNGQSVNIDNNNYAFYTGYHYEQVTEVYGDNFFNSILKGVLEEYRLEYNMDGNDIVFKNVLEDEEEEFEETPGYMVLVETQKKISKMIEGFPAEELFQIKKDNEDIFKNLINYHYDC